MKRAGGRFVAVTLALTVATLSACSSSGSSSKGSGAASSTSAGGGGGAAGGSAPAGSTVDVGLANMNTGALSFPGATTGAQVAAKYLNATKTGMAGHKIKLVTCDMKNDNEAAQGCGQKFASDSSMPFGLVSLTINGAPFAAAMNGAKKPAVYGIATTPDQEKASLSYTYDAGNTAFMQANANRMKSLGVKSIAYLYDQDPSGSGLKDTFVADLKGSGITVKTTGVPPTASDYTSAFSASSARSADLVFIWLPQCALAAKTMQTLGLHPKYVFTNTSCLTNKVLSANPGYYDSWYNVSSAKLPLPGSTDPSTKQFNAAWAKYGTAGTPPTYAEVGWSVVMNAASALANVKNLTSTTADAAFKAYTGPSAMGPPSSKCGVNPATPAVCQTGIVTYQVVKGKFVLQNG